MAYLLPVLCPLALGCFSVAAPPATEKGQVHFQPALQEQKNPLRYQLAKHYFPYEMNWSHSLPGNEVEVFHLRFPSPVESPHKENNTVHAEYYRPKGKGPFPGVIVLDITAGNQDLSRLISASLAGRQIAGLFVQMAYYGPRRPPGSNLRMVSPDFKQSLEAVRQTVLDIRRASAWLGARSEINPGRLGIHGTSLGSFIAALSAEMEPRLHRVSLLLGGGGLAEGFYNHPQAEPFRQAWEAMGGTKEKLAELIAPADPLTYAERLQQRRLLMIAGKRDEIVLPQMAEALWKASGRQKIVWYDCTHVGAVLYTLPILNNIINHHRGD